MTETAANENINKPLDSGKHIEGGTEQSDTFDKAFQMSVEAVKVESAEHFPIEIDIAAEFQNIFAAGILRNVDYINLYDTLCETLFSDRGVKLGQLLFWMVFCTKFQPENDFLPELRQKISKLYSKIFTLLPQPKDTLTNLLVYVTSYAIHITFWDVFTDKALFNMRFILDCYHIVLFELHGVFVSDQSIQNSIEKLFGSKFFFYESKQDKKPKKTEIKDRKDQPLLRDLFFNPDSLLHHEGGIEFAAELSSKLRDKNRHENSPHDKSKHYGSIRKSPLAPGDASVSSNLQKKGTESKFRNSVETQDTSTTNIQEESDNKKVYFPKIRFDCTQISPTVLRFLNTTTGKTMSQKKKLTIHADNKHLTAMRNYKVAESIDTILTVHPVAHEKKKSKKDNMMRDYSIKNRPEDYYLEYLPKKLKDRFKEELDLKYVLDHVGTYSLQAKKIDLEVKHKAKEMEKVDKIAEKYFGPVATIIGMYRSASAVVKDSEIADPEVKSIELDSPDVGPVKKRLFSQFDSENVPLHESVSPSNMVQNKRKDDFVLESKLVESQSMPKNPETEESPVSGSHLLIKKLSKGQSLKKNPLLPLLKSATLSFPQEPAQQKKEFSKENPNKSDYIPERKMKIQNINLERNERRKADFFDYENEKEEKKSDAFVYEDRRKKYTGEHGRYVHRSVDANINDLVSRVIQTKKNISTRKNFSNQRPIV